MKSFIKYLTENHRTFDFKVRIAANECDAECIKKIKAILETYKVISISDPKRLPIQESPEFPNAGPIEINIMEISLGYPVNDEKVRVLITNATGISPSNIKVTPLHSPYEAALDGKEQSNQGPEGESVLMQSEMVAEKVEKDLVGDARIPNLIKELEETRKYQYPEVAGGASPAAKTTNDLPVGQTSPMTKQNKIPVPKNMKAGNKR